MRQWTKNIFRMSLVLSSVLFLGCQGFVTREGLKEQEQKKEITEKVTTLQRSNADVNNRFADIESDLREVHGKVEVLENRLGQNSQNQERTKKASDDQVAKMQKKLVVLQEEISKMQDQISTLAADLASARAAAPADRGAGGGSDRSAFDVAEEHFEKKEWRKAILNYQKFREQKPKDKKVPEVIYKIGVCFQELGMKDEAKSFYEEVTGKYPGSAEAKKAKSRIKKLK